MALIWAEGFTGEKALAPLWRRHAVALARSQDRSLSPSDRGAAIVEAEDTKIIYDNTVAEAEAALAQTATREELRTHALVVGVGRYKNAGIKALTTSVHGAWAFADWMLRRFHHLNRPLGSVELILSPSDSLGDWKPSPEAAEKLGLTDGSSTTTLPVEAATFTNIKNAFNRWLKRAGTHLDNAAFFYFSGHGLWKSEPFLLPEDAQIAKRIEGFDNLIDVQQTQINMFNTQPSVQCFFIDACQEVISQLVENPTTRPPALVLWTPANAPVIPDRDAWRYEGAFPSRKAFGPADSAPFFTQELVACLERRGAAPAKIANAWRVTTSSLKEALEAAWRWREEADREAQGIKFSTAAPGSSSTTATLCHIQGSPEVIVEVRCHPATAMPRAKLFVESGGVRSPRPQPLPSPWYTTVTQGDCSAGAEFEASAALATTPENFEARPPVHPVQLMVQPRV